MRKASFVGALCVLVLAAAPAQAQFSLGVGGGGGIGSRGAGSGGYHGVAFAELKLPLVPGVRADAFLLDTPSGPISDPHQQPTSELRYAGAVSAVFSLPVPVLKPYLIAGWGTYPVYRGGSRSGWNLGAGVHTALPAGPSVFVEIRRHDQVSRDLITVGLRF